MSITTASTEDVSLEKNGIYLLMGEISADTCKPAIEWILKNDFSDDPWSEMTLVVNSSGGSLTDAFALIDVMRGAQANIGTVGIGEIASAGLLILCLATRVNDCLPQTLPFYPINFLGDRMVKSMSYLRPREVLISQPR